MISVAHPPWPKLWWDKQSADTISSTAAAEQCEQAEAAEEGGSGLGDDDDDGVEAA